MQALTHGKSMFVYSFGSIGELLYKVYFLPKLEDWEACLKWRELDRPMREFVNSYLLRLAHAKLSWNTQCLWFCNVKAEIYPKVSWSLPSSNIVFSIEGQPRIPRPRTRPTWTSNIRKIYSRRICLTGTNLQSHTTLPINMKNAPVPSKYVLHKKHECNAYKFLMSLGLLSWRPPYSVYRLTK